MKQMKILFLLPPSEGKNQWWATWVEKLSFDFVKPYEIAINATQKDLKCQWNRYEEWIRLNKDINNSELLPAIKRYSGVMYNAINYTWMDILWQEYFEKNFLILTGMYGVVRPCDMVWNYKLPIETKWLYNFWAQEITDTLEGMHADYIVDMLPWSYAKMIDWKKMNTKRIQIHFLHHKNGELKKITHWVKKVKGEYIKNICGHSVQAFENMKEKKVQISEKEYYIEVISET